MKESYTIRVRMVCLRLDRESSQNSSTSGIKHVMVIAEHQHTNGLVEEINRALTETLAAYVNVAHMDWDEKLGDSNFAINTAKKSTTLFPRYELVYERRPHLPLDYFSSLNRPKIRT